MIFMDIAVNLERDKLVPAPISDCAPGTFQRGRETVKGWTNECLSAYVQEILKHF